MNIQNLIGRKISFRYILCGQILRKTGVVTAITTRLNGCHQIFLNDNEISSYEVKYLVNLKILE